MYKDVPFQHEIDHDPKLQGLATFVAKMDNKCHGSVRELLRPRNDISQMVSDFAGSIIPKEAVEVAKYSSVGKLFSDELFAPNIWRSLKESMLHDTKEHNRYMLALLADVPYITQYVDDRYAGSTTYSVNPESLDFEGLAGLVESVNVESIIIQACREYTDLCELMAQNQDLEDNRDKIIKSIYAINTLYGPLTELTGFDALAAEMMNKVYKWQVLHLPNGEEILTIAKAKLDILGDREKIASVEKTVVSQLFGESYQETFLGQDSGHDLHYTDGQVTMDGEGSKERVRLLSRLKTLGSTAKKMSREGVDQLPADIIGMTIICKDDDQTADVYDRLLIQIEAIESLSIVNAPSREEDIQVKGSESFIHKLATKFASKPREYRVKPELSANGFEAAKVTLSYRENGVDYPIEIQITHEDSRRASRVGLASHTIFKLEKLFGIKTVANKKTLDILEAINKRRSDLQPDALTVCPASDIRVDTLINSASSARNIGIGTKAILRL